MFVTFYSSYLLLLFLPIISSIIKQEYIILYYMHVIMIIIYDYDYNYYYTYLYSYHRDLLTYLLTPYYYCYSCLRLPL
jgi:hypothetical protein